MADDSETFTWDGRTLPLWEFEHWRDAENFVDELCPETYVLTINRELATQHITGLVFSREPMEPDNAVAVYRITDPEPE